MTAKTKKRSNKVRGSEDDPSVTLFVTKETLSDDSVAFNVILGEYTFAAVDENGACAMAEAIADAINDYGTDVAGVIYEN